ncbi:alginate lyase family protein [Daejeonella lutea]|uniref:Alginate lyase n=1 Tax=Daejeonella lutea TaxID=572036 RepID=A0A1T5BEH1_9SPHI|nr:alginate lyase family protein [Daejeonella lutea]SKB45618.1 Alginate lyase [Daejeonella lutea]
MKRFITCLSFTLLYSVSLSAQEVFLIDPQVLQKNKKAYEKKDPAIVKKVDQIIRRADEMLNVKPLSVMDKNFTPSSGTKHDYMSMGPYWWPDPAKPDGLPYIRKDGQRNPEINRITDRDYLGQLETRCKYLSLAYYFTGRPQYAEKANELIRVWFLNPETKMNPNLNFGQAIPGLNEGRGIGIIESRLLAYLVDWIDLLSADVSFAKNKPGLQDWFAQYLSWLLESKNGVDESKAENNHGTFYELQVASFAAFTNNKTQIGKTFDKLKDRIKLQIHEDGKQPLELERTNAYSYSAMNLSGWYSLALLGEKFNYDLWKLGGTPPALHRAIEWLIPFTVGIEKRTYEQINPFNKEDVYSLLKIAHHKYKEESFNNLANSYKPSTATAIDDLLYSLPGK